LRDRGAEKKKGVRSPKIPNGPGDGVRGRRSLPAIPEKKKRGRKPPRGERSASGEKGEKISLFRRVGTNNPDSRRAIMQRGMATHPIPFQAKDQTL